MRFRHLFHTERSSLCSIVHHKMIMLTTRIRPERIFLELYKEKRILFPVAYGYKKIKGAKEQWYIDEQTAKAVKKSMSSGFQAKDSHNERYSRMASEYESEHNNCVRNNRVQKIIG